MKCKAKRRGKPSIPCRRLARYPLGAPGWCFAHWKAIQPENMQRRYDKLVDQLEEFILPEALMRALRSRVVVQHWTRGTK